MIKSTFFRLLYVCGTIDIFMRKYIKIDFGMAYNPGVVRGSGKHRVRVDCLKILFYFFLITFFLNHCRSVPVLLYVTPIISVQGIKNKHKN